MNEHALLDNACDRLAHRDARDAQLLGEVPLARERADAIQRLTGVELTVDEVLDSPHVFIGSVTGLTDKILALRERLGISSFMVGEMGPLDRLVERLAGQ